MLLDYFIILCSSIMMKHPSQTMKRHLFLLVHNYKTHLSSSSFKLSLSPSLSSKSSCTFTTSTKPKSKLAPFLTKQPKILIKKPQNSSSSCNEGDQDSHILTQKDLARLFTHELTAIQIKEFYPKQSSIELGKELSDIANGTNNNESNETRKVNNWNVVTSDRGLERSDVWTMGDFIPYNVAVATNEIDQYFDGVQRDLKNRRRRQGKPFLWPLDQLRLELDEIWNHGASLAREKGHEGDGGDNCNSGRVMGGGLPRVMFGPTRWKKGFIHADQYSPLSNDHGLFTANIYLQLPGDDTDSNRGGGELHIWNLDIRSDYDWFSNQDLLEGMTVQDAEMQIKLRKALGEPSVINVCPGDLVLFCVQKPHAVVGFQHGTRVSLQCFMQYHGLNSRLLVDI